MRDFFPHYKGFGQSLVELLRRGHAAQHADDEDTGGEPAAGRPKGIKRYLLGFPWFRTTTDFVVTSVAITVVLLFMLSLFKIMYATDKYLVAKMSDPRINILSVRADHLSDGLSELDIDRLKELGGESVRKVVPSYNMNLWLMNEKGEFTRIPGKMGTFRANDEIILSIFENDDTIVDKNLKNLPFLTSSDQFDGLIIYRKRIKNILRRLNLPQDPRTLNIGFNTRNAIPLRVILVDNYLPNETVGMIREELNSACVDIFSFA